MLYDTHALGVGLAKQADARRTELERDRRVPPDLFRHAGEAGLFRQMICADLGGLGRCAADWFRTGVEMARWEPSFSWVVTQGAADHAVYIAAGDAAFASALLADPDGYSSSSTNGTGILVPEGDGYRVEGRWAFCSGCQGATWVGGWAELPLATGQGAAAGRYILVPIERARIEESWDVMGMLGTGSHTIVVEQQYIPSAWALDISRIGPRDYGPMSVAAGNSAWPIATAVAAVQLGISRRALDATGDLVLLKPGRGGYAKLIDNAYVQRRLMSAEGGWLAAYTSVEQALIRLWRDAKQSRRLPIDTRIALAIANIHAATTALEIVESMCDLAGTSVAAVNGIFAACLRDVRTLSGHGAVGGHKLETAARMKFGFIADSFSI